MPPLTKGIDLRQPIVLAVTAGAFVGLCPAIHEDHHHIPDRYHVTDLTYTDAVAFTSTGVNSITPGTGALNFSGYSPKILIGPSR